MGQLVSEVTDILNNKKANSDVESQKKTVLAQIAADEKAKTNLVKKALAAQRAQYGAGGMTGKGMTEESVLKRLQEETEQPFNEKKKTNLEKISKLKTSKTNLLKSIVSRFDDLMG